MKTIGLIGGMSWASTLTYYRIINEAINQKLGGQHSAKILLSSIDFAEIENCQTQEDWDQAAEILATEARSLEMAGAEIIVLCTNMMHLIADKIQQDLMIPLLHITEPIIGVLQQKKVKKVALLGTRHTMTMPFYKDKLQAAGISVILPEKDDMTLINDVIYNELCKGIIKSDSRQHFRRIIDNLSQQGAEMIILGCTEIGLLINQDDISTPLLDTAELHARYAVEVSLKM